MTAINLILGLVHRANTTSANVIPNISIDRFTNITDQWGGWSNATIGPPNWGTILWQVVSVYPDFMGPVAWFILFSLPFIMMWITHSDMVPAAIIGLFFGLYVYNYVGIQYQVAGLAMICLALTTIILSLWTKRGW